MSQSNISTWFQFVLQQAAAESYLDQLASGRQLKDILTDGNNDIRVIPSELFLGKTRFTDQLTSYFVPTPSSLPRYQIIDHHANDATGFSATLIKDLSDPTGKTYTLSLRSTEFPNQIQGGDWERDGRSGADGEIFDHGFAFAQLVSLERYYRELKADPAKLPPGAILNVTGYSLGGHLATVFTELHETEVAQTVTFNGAGRGRIVEQGQVGQPEAQSIRRMLSDLEARLLVFDPTGSRFLSGAAGNIYNEAAYDQARTAMQAQFVTFGTLSIGSTGLGEARSGGAFDKITQLVGKGLTGTDVFFVANSGIHAQSISVMIEGQPQIEGRNEQGQLQFGNTHSLTLLMDSLAVQTLFESLDPDLIQADIEGILQAASNARADTFAATFEEHVAEGDTLELALDALRALFMPNALDKTTDFNDDTGGFGNLGTRTEFYTHLAEVQAIVANQTFSIEPLVQRDSHGRVVPRLTAAELVAEAQGNTDQGLAYRYALRTLNPFAVVGVDYVGLGHAANGKLALYDPATGFGEITEQYLTDRAAFLLAKLDLTLNNRTTPSDSLSLTHYGDAASRFDVPAGVSSFAREYLFGSDQEDALTGSQFLPTDDHLYGGVGSDDLRGFGGDDYLQGDSGDDRLDGGTGGDTLHGGLGFDTYVLTADGTDRIEDGDDRGVIQLNGRLLMGGVRKEGDAENTYKSLDGQWTFVQSGSTLTLNGAVTIQHWQPGALGIELRDLSASPTDPGLPTGPFAFTVIGGPGNNDLDPPGAGPSALYGHGGDDILEGDHTPLLGAFDDLLDGGVGNDTLIAGLGHDYLLGGPGDDYAYVDDGDYFFGGDDADIMAGSTVIVNFTNATIGSGTHYGEGGEGNDVLMGGLGIDVLKGDAGDDQLWGENRPTGWLGRVADGIGGFISVPQHEFFRAAGAADYLDGGAGDDYLRGDGGDDVLIGGDDNDQLWGDDQQVAAVQEGADWLDGGAGDDFLWGGGGNDRLIGGNGVDILTGDFLNDPIGGDDWLDGGTGNDTLMGGRGDDVLFGGADADFLLGNEGHDVLDGGSGDDELQGGSEADVLWGGTGIDRLFGDDGNDQLFGDDDNDFLLGDAGADTLLGGAGDDQLQGGDGEDILIGGAGTDTLMGGAGADTYVFNLGDGVESIQDTPGEGNKIVFGAGIFPEDISVGIGSLVVRVGLTGDAIHIQGFDPAATMVPVGIETFEFADGTRLTQADLVARGFDLIGTAGDDTLNGSEIYRTLYGLDGDDFLTGGNLDNVIHGGQGRDVMFGNGGSDQLLGGVGDDVIQAGAGNDVLNGEAGNDSLEGEAGDDVLDGGAGNDQLSGGEGADQLFGSEGDDFILTDAEDTVRDGGAGIDTISFQGVFGVTFDLGSSNFENAIGTESNDTLTAASAVGPVQLFGNGGSDTLTGGAGDDVLVGGEVFVGEGAADTLIGGAGNDQLEGGTGDDAYVFNLGDGQDRIVDSAVREDPVGGGEEGSGGTILENNRLIFGTGIDSQALRLSVGPGAIPLLDGIPTGSLRLSVGASDSLIFSDFDAADLFSRYSIESFEFADSPSLTYAQLVEERGFDILGTNEDEGLTGTAVADRISGFDGQDVLRSGFGADTLDGGAGDDQLFGGAGNDSYVFGVGAGQDVVFDQAGLDTIRIGAGIAPRDVRAAREANDLILAVPSTGESLRLQNFYLHAVFQVEQVTFADGTVWDHARLLASTRRQINGTDGDDLLTGGTTDDTIMGLAGADSLSGQAGDDVLDGGTGADVMTGGDGEDTYLVDDIGDLVTEAISEGTDTVLSGITYSLTSNVENLILSGTATIDGTGNELDNVLTGNPGANVLTGGAGDDTYVIEAGDLVVEAAGEGIDTVVTDQSYLLGANVENLTLTGTSAHNGTGNELDNVLAGNGGVNVLTGGAGNDTYVIGADDLVVEAPGEGTDTIVTTQDYVLGDAIENLSLTGNHSVNGVGNELDNRLAGNTAANVLQGGLGDDTYVVGSDDLVVEAADAGTDTVEAAESYALGAHIENLTLLDTFPTLRIGLTPGTDGSVPVGLENHYSGIGNELNNVLTGNRGDNVLEGLGGNDVLNGQGGDDTLKGGEGADTYLFGLGGGQDRIEDQSVSGEIDSVQLAPGLAPHHIGVVQSENDLVLRMPGSKDSLTLADFFGPPSAAQKSVRFHDGTVWNEAALRQLGADPGQGITIVDTDSGDNVLLGSGGHDVLTGGSGNDTLIGDGGNDIIKDLAGNNVYDGGSGDDTLIGSAGNDSFRFGRGYGRDVVLVDQLFNDAFTTDTDHVQMVGLNPSDVIIQRQSSATGQLSFTITVLDTADQLTVRFRNGIYGFAPAPVTLNFADGTSQELGLFTDFPAAPSLTVFSSVDYALEGDEEHLVLVDSNSSVVPNSRIGIGNGLDNVILGNTADNVLEGGAGHDVLHGGFARSVEGFFFVDSGSDILIGGEGNDTLIPFGDSAFAFDFGVGTDPNPFNTPDDVLIGGPGNDTYYIRHASQTLVELPGEGVDTVHSTVSYSLPDNFENLVLTPAFHEETGFASLTGTGNESDNVLVGGAGADLLSGGAGRDTLHGGLNATFDAGDSAGFPSSDTLIGGTGDDTYLFNLGDGIDVIEDVAAVGQGNRIQFGTGIARNDLTFSQDDVARTLTIGVGASGTDQLVLTNFDPTNANGSLVVETLAFADGSTASLASLLGGPVNQMPTVVTPLAEQTVLEDALLSIQIPTSTFVDQDAHDVLAYSASLADATALPTWLTFDSVTHTFGGIPTNSEVGTLHLAVTATDSGGLSATSSFALTVQNVNDTPTMAMPLADQSVTQGSLFTFIVPADSFADVDAGDILTYHATRADGTALPTWLTFNPSTRMFSGTPQGPDIGTLAVRVTATDSGTLSVNDVFALTILPILGTEGNDTLIGAGGDDVIQGLAGDDVLQGLAGNDLLDGGVGVDSMAGGLGNDAFVVDVAGDVVTEALNQGTDTVYSGITYTLGANVENLVLTGTGVVNGTGNSLNNSLTGNNANNILNGGAGADKMVGGQGNDIYVVDNVGDVVTELENEGIDTVQTGRTHTLGANLENLTLTGSAMIDGTGNSLDNTLRGNSVANVLTGGAGNDIYVVGTGDTVVEQLNEGIDRVQSAVTWTLAANVEQLTLTGAAAINGTGNSLNNVLIGNSAPNVLDAESGDDTLNGGAGEDTLIGGIGNDTYIVDNVGDVVIENINEGTDLVQSSVSYLLTASVEDLTLTGTVAINATGNSLNNMLTGNSGANILDGAAGADTMIGGTGNDTYVVDDAGDAVTEIANQGIDTVQSAITYVLGMEVENLTLIGSTAIDGTGTGLNNILEGNIASNILTGLDGNDRLDGGAGADTLVGGVGNDIYVVDNEDDIVTENLNEGTDLVQSTVSYTLTANVEHLTLTGITAISGIGNVLNNRLTGNSAANQLAGGLGNDTYVVSAGDTVIELANEGMDTVQSEVSWTLGANLENLTLTGLAASDATGNTLNNRLTGNDAGNQLVGGAGNDTMRGGLGNDTYLIDRGEGRDVIVENDSTSGNSDLLQYGATINPLDLVISRQVNDLRLAVHGSTDQVTIKDWYLSTNHQIETVQAGDGTLLLSMQVDQLIQAMASFSQQSGLTWDQAIDQRPQDVQAILAASWQ